MIKNIAVKNFKSLKDISLPISNLNILSGLNGSGKSSFIQTLLLLRQSFQGRGNAGLMLKGELISLGTGKDVFYHSAGKEEDVEFKINSDNKQYNWIFKYKTVTDVLEIKEFENINLESFNLFNNNFQYLNTEHISPKDFYEKSENQVVQLKNIGIKGEYAAHYLKEFGTIEKIIDERMSNSKAITDSLGHQVDAWISEISPGAKIVVEDLKNIDYIRLAVKFETKDGFTNEVKPINTGFGISYVLPVIISILKARKGDILILENPESHLHPKGQSTIGKLMAYAAQAGVQIFVETHSDHVINGIRVAVKEGKLSPKNSKIYYFKRMLNETEQYSAIKEIKIDKNGSLSNYPDGFLDEWGEQLMELL